MIDGKSKFQVVEHEILEFRLRNDCRDFFFNIEIRDNS